MIPHNTIEPVHVYAAGRRERSLAAHAHLMHLPAGESFLKRLLRRLGVARGRQNRSGVQPSPAPEAGPLRPPAFSR